MHETLCFSIQSPSPNLDDLPLRCDGCETVSCVVGSCSDHGRMILGSVPHCKWGFTCFSCMCGRQNSIVICNCRIVPANGIASGAGGGVADGVLKEVSHEMRFWEIADARNPMFSIQSPSPNLDDLPLRCDGCETVSCVVGSCSDHSRIGSAL